MIDISTLPFAQGQEGAGHRHRQRPIDRLGLRQGLSRFRRRPRHDLSQRQGQEITSSRLPRNLKLRFSCRSISRPKAHLEAIFEQIEKQWGKLDICLHSIAFAPKADLQGRVVDCSKEGFLLAMEVSCWSFIRMAKLAEPLMKDGGTLSTMTYYGSQMVVENYNMMGPVKAALEAVTRYLAAELGPKGIRVHAISPGPLKTRAASGITDFDKLIAKAQAKAPARSLVSIEDVGVAVAFLSMNGAKLITGETLYIDGGYHIID